MCVCFVCFFTFWKNCFLHLQVWLIFPVVSMHITSQIQKWPAEANKVPKTPPALRILSAFNGQTSTHSHEVNQCQIKRCLSSSNVVSLILTWSWHKQICKRKQNKKKERKKKICPEEMLLQPEVMYRKRKKQKTKQRTKQTLHRTRIWTNQLWIMLLNTLETSCLLVTASNYIFYMHWCWGGKSLHCNTALCEDTIHFNKIWSEI